ncbi:PAS domain S-box-containing protein [Aquiflexum balticum DSM 16537]|uniref:histidine kinase n=1 Tax=Aquiflexum balticum DSM 16537 TaxID=758820 RepID=A0A1W2H9R8_9BACT|nr:PAS domain S-box protein [Aquiflexum balticum]SMD45534.1 PAS domain S-box-containing protein [Aquiflexum balticum DSM 16537]
MKKSIDYSGLFYHNKHPSWIYDLKNFQIVEVNQSALDLFGYSREEFLTLTLNNLTPEKEFPAFLKATAAVDKTEGNFHFGVFTHQKKNGELLLLEVDGYKLKFDDLDSVLLTCQDLTQHEKQLGLLKEKSKQLEAISCLGKIGYWRLELDGNTLSWTDEVFKIWGRNKSDFELNFENFEETIHPEDLEAFRAALNAAFAGKEALDFEHRINLPDGSIHWVRQKGGLLKNNEGKPYAFECAVQDITHKKETESRLLEITAELQESEKRFRVVQEMSPDGFTILKPVRNKKGAIVDFEWIYENKAIAKINHTDPDEVIGKRLLEMFPSHHDSDVFKAYIAVADIGKTKILEDVYVGEIVSIKTWLRLVIVSIGNDEIAILSEDITVRKMAEDSLQKSEANFRSIFEIASLGIAQVDPSNGRIILINSFYESITGYNAEELRNMSFLELTHPEDRGKDWEIFSKAARGEAEYRNEKRYIKKDGTIIWVRIHLAFIRDENGKPIKTVAICEDITERKEAEFRLRDLADNLPGVVFQYLLFPDGTDALRSVSKGAYQIWGYSPEEVERDINLVWNQTKSGGEFERVKKDVMDAVKTKSKWLSRYKSILPNGDVRIFLGMGSPNFLADGTVLFNSFVLDITQQAKNEELLSEATQMARIGSWEVNFANNKILWSDMTHELHETDPCTFIPDLENTLAFYREDFRDMVRYCVQECQKTGKPFDFEAVIVTAKNNERWVRAIGRAEMIGGHCRRIIGSFQDINAYKAIEIELAQSIRMLQDYQYAVDQSASFTITDAEGVIVEVNDNFCELSQYSREELIGTTHRYINSNYHSDEFFDAIWKTIKSGKIWRGEVRNQKKDGSYFWVDTTIVPFFDENNHPFKFLALRIDITAKKMAEAQIKEAYEKLKNIAWTQSHIVRAPLARILGIVNLIETQKDSLDDLMYWLNQLKTSSDEMDEIVRKIIEDAQFIQHNKPK